MTGTADGRRGPLESALEQTRHELVELHRELTRNGLVAWTSGNVSARIPDSELVLIKPSGLSYDELTPDSMVLVDLDGTVLDGDLAPSSDTATHLYVYRSLEGIAGIVHTHSPYATAWAAHGRPIPCVLTAMADEFGGEIPVGPFALIGGEEIGVAIVETLAESRSPAVLMRSHGVFTIGATARDAVKAAVMCEDVARTTLLARTLGELTPLDPTAIDALYERYQNVYGQRPVDALDKRGLS
jgi:L-ribulose-5-phosphate 4-epimerase